MNLSVQSSWEFQEQERASFYSESSAVLVTVWNMCMNICRSLHMHRIEQDISVRRDLQSSPNSAAWPLQGCPWSLSKCLLNTVRLEASEELSTSLPIPILRKVQRTTRSPLSLLQTALIHSPQLLLWTNIMGGGKKVSAIWLTSENSPEYPGNVGHFHPLLLVEEIERYRYLQRLI